MHVPVGIFYASPVELIAHWWNQRWGSIGRRDVWLERLDDGRFQVRWRGGAWADRDGRYVTASAAVAVSAVRDLLESHDADWRQLPVR